MPSFPLTSWLYTVKTFGAAMLALGIGFWADLDRPYWAMATVYIASQPFAGTTRSKAIFRLLGTVLGSAAAIALVPNLVDQPIVLSLALSGWLALCLTLSLLDRTPRGYVFMLAGYTAAIIGFPSVSEPGAIWDTAVARTEEISLGIVCASLVSILVFPRHLGPAIASRTNAWLQDARLWTLDILRETPISDAVLVDRRHLAADAVEIGALATQLSYDSSDYLASAPAAGALHARLLMILPILASVADRLAALRAANGIDDRLALLLKDIANWVEVPGRDPAGLHAAIGTMLRAAEAEESWSEIMRASLLLRLGELVKMVHDCRALREHVQAARPGLPRLAGGVEAQAASLQHRDVRMAAISGFSAGMAVLAVCTYWIGAGWVDGSAAALIAAVGCCFFATLDDPAPAIMQFLHWSVVAIVVDAIYLFAILPAIDGFPMLALVLAPTFLIYGLLGSQPKTAPIGIALGVNGATLLALQPVYSASFASFANSGIATIIGLASAAIATQLLRSVGAEWSAWRLVRANWNSLADAARRRGQGDRRAFAGLMVDRIGLVVSRLGAVATARAPDTRRLQADLRVGLNIVDLRRARHDLPPACVQRIDRVLDRVAMYFSALARAPLAGQPADAPPELLHAIDDSVAKLITLPASAARRDAMLGLVGIRLSLFPSAQSFELPPAGPAELKRAA